MAEGTDAERLAEQRRRTANREEEVKRRLEEAAAKLRAEKIINRMNKRDKGGSQ